LISWSLKGRQNAKNNRKPFYWHKKSKIAKKFPQLQATIYIFLPVKLLTFCREFALNGQNLTAQAMGTPSLAHARQKSKRLRAVVPRPLVRREPLLAG